MKRFLCILVLSFLAMCFSANGRVSLMRNGSFEKNGHGISDITQEAPIYWCDMNIPDNKFESWVSTYGSTEGQYALTLSTTTWNVVLGDTATVSQEVFLESDVNSLSFDLHLSSGYFLFPWDASLRTFFIAVDGNIIWDSNHLEIDGNGEYFGTVEANFVGFSQYLNDDWHALSLGLRVNQTHSPDTEYSAEVDFIKFDKYCGGLGYLAADLDQDCYVTLDDLAELVASWMSGTMGNKADLDDDGSVNFTDYALFAEDWLYNTDWKKWGQNKTLQMEKLDLDPDLSGAVDLGDVMVLSEYWLSDGTCAGVELAGNEVESIVNFMDFAVIVNHWGERDWLYYAD